MNHDAHEPHDRGTIEKVNWRVRYMVEKAGRTNETRGNCKGKLAIEDTGIGFSSKAVRRGKKYQISDRKE